jgi:hypothetical protein
LLLLLLLLHAACASWLHPHLLLHLLQHPASLRLHQQQRLLQQLRSLCCCPIHLLQS